MIAKESWFEIRKYGGWGLGIKTWQGWIYLLFILIPFFMIGQIDFANETIKAYILLAWICFIFIDIFPIVFFMKKDEREIIHEAKAERNASWAMVVVLTFSILYEILISIESKNFNINIFIILALLAGAFAKSITYIILEKKGNKNE